VLRLLAIAAVLAVFAATYGVHYLHKENKQERVAASWGYRLIWDAISDDGERDFTVASVESGPGDNQWQLYGQLATEKDAPAEVGAPFVAKVVQVCQSLSEQRCWRLNDLEVAGRRLSGTGSEALVMAIPDDKADVFANGKAAELEPLEGSEAKLATAEAPPAPKLSSAITMVPLNNGVADAAPADAAPEASTADSPAAVMPVAAVAAEETTEDTAVAATQTAALPQPAEPEPAEVETLVAADESLVFLIQDRLQWLGYGDREHLPHHGRLDARTRDAILSYQRKNGLPDDGRPTRALLDHMETYVRRLSAIQQGGTSTSATVQKVALQEDPGLISFRMAVDANQRGKVDQAIVHYTRAIESTTLPERHRAYLLRGKAFAGKGNYRQAISDYSAAIRLAPGYADAWINRGIAHAAMESYDDALADLQKGQVLDPGNAVAEQAMQQLEQGSRMQ